MGPNSFDCSGFTSYVYGQFGYKLNRVSGSQPENGVAVNRQNLQPGDLVFFKGRNAKSERIGHVGMVVSANPDGTFSFIHASTTRGVTHSESTENYYVNRYVTACRVINQQTAYENHPITFTPPLPEAPEAKTIELIHIVEKGQTIYSISKQHGCTPGQICEWNNLDNNNLSIGQMLKINTTIAEIPQQPEEKVRSIKTAKPITHIVKKGETLFSIAQQYYCSVMEITEWNNLTSEALSIGQKLLVCNPSDQAKTASTPKASSKPTFYTVKKGDNLGEIADKYNISVANLKKLNHLSSTKIKAGQKLQVK